MVNSNQIEDTKKSDSKIINQYSKVQYTTYFIHRLMKTMMNKI